MRIVIPFLFLLLLVTPVFAETFQYCADNTTLVKKSEVTIDVPQKNITRTFNVTQGTIICEFGCDVDHNQCFRSQSINWLIVIGVIFGFIFMLLLIMWLLP